MDDRIDRGLGSWPGRRARMDGAAIAFSQGERSLDYATLASRVDALAAGLARLGVRAGDRVAYLGPNDIATFETFFATGRLGAIFVPLNLRLAAVEIAYMLADCSASVLIHGPDQAELVRPAAARASDVRQNISLASDYESLLAGADGSDLLSVDVDLDDDALILYTSGTTGRPKGAVLTHGNLTWNTINQLAHLDVLRSDTVVCTAPLFHVTGLGQVSLPTLFKGGRVVVAPKFDPAGLLRTITELRVTAFSAVPTMLQMLCDHPDWAGADLSSLRYVVFGGSPVDERVARAWLDRGVEILQGYGMTEAAPGVLMALPGQAAAHPLSTGVPHFFTDLKLRALEGSEPGSSRGELLVRGPNVFRGYWRRADETAAVLDARGWYSSGDVLQFDDDGWGYVVDRVKDVIISGGENVYPAEVEAVLRDLPGIADCAVVGTPDPRWGEVPVAYLVITPGVAFDEASLRGQLESQLARFKVPKYLRVVSDLPRTATGKVRRSVLRRQQG
jgi:fatty-acyl-CoA synthase